MSTPPWPIPSLLGSGRVDRSCRASGRFALQRIAFTEAAGARAPAHERLARRELVGGRSCAFFLSTARWYRVWWVGPSARRRIRPWLARNSARPHPALVSSPGRTASPQILLRAGRPMLASRNSPAIAEGSQQAKTGWRRRPRAARASGRKSCPDLRHLRSTRFSPCRLDARLIIKPPAFGSSCWVPRERGPWGALRCTLVRLLMNRGLWPPTC